MPEEAPPEAVDPGDWVCLAEIGAPKGLRGAVRAICFNETPAGIAGFNPLHAGPGGRPLRVRAIGTPRNGRAVLAVEGVTDRDGAAALAGVRLYAPRDRLPETGEDEFYRHDLIGLPVEHVDGRPLGAVKALLDYGAGDVLEVAGRDGRADFLLPFTRENVPAVDVRAGRIAVDPPEGTLDDA